MQISPLIVGRWVALGLGMALLLLGCAHQASQGDATSGNFMNTPACTNNAFLQRYGCSLDNIEQAAENNDPDAEYALGYMYYYGIGTVKDVDTALIWIKRAAEQGQPLAIKAVRLIRQSEFHEMGGIETSTVTGPSSSDSQKLPERPQLAPARVVGSTAQKTQESVPAQVQTLPEKSTSLARSAIESVPLKKQISNAQPVSGGHYTLQLMSSYDLAPIRALMRAYNLHHKANYYLTYHEHQKWYVLIYGRYPSVASAKQATHELPKGILAMHPWVKPYHLVLEEQRHPLQAAA